jgi:hypothetical protein
VAEVQDNFSSPANALGWLSWVKSGGTGFGRPMAGFPDSRRIAALLRTARPGPEAEVS